MPSLMQEIDKGLHPVINNYSRIFLQFKRESENETKICEKPTINSLSPLKSRILVKC